MTRLIKEPLLHFLLLGALIFVGNAWLNRDAASKDKLIVSLAQQENLARTFSRTWQRLPTTEELDGLIRDYVREQIAYRESLALGLDKEDIIIRRRMRQKLELLTEDLATLAPPSDDELKVWLDSHPGDFRLPASSSLQQIYFSIDDSMAAAEQAAGKLLSLLAADESAIDIESAGDRSLLPSQLENVSDRKMRSIFGGEFADEVARLEPGRWSGPVRSGYGIHLVKLDSRIEGRAPTLEEVSDAVARDWFAARKAQAIDALYEQLAEKYAISIEQATETSPQ